MSEDIKHNLHELARVYDSTSGLLGLCHHSHNLVRDMQAGCHAAYPLFWIPSVRNGVAISSFSVSVMMLWWAKEQAMECWETFSQELRVISPDLAPAE